MELGKWNILRIDRIKDVGAYLTDGRGLVRTWKKSDEDLEPEVMDILLPTRQIPEGCEVGDNVRVFIYRDSDDRPIATTHEPKIELGEIRKLAGKEN